MGIEANGHLWEWQEQYCIFCGMSRDDALGSDRFCIGGFLAGLDLSWLLDHWDNDQRRNS